MILDLFELDGKAVLALVDPDMDIAGLDRISASDYMHGAIVPVDGGWLTR